MIDDDKKRTYLILIGAGLMGVATTFAILILTGVLTPNIFPPTGQPLDLNPLTSALLTFLLLSIIVYVGNKIIVHGLNYKKKEEESESSKINS